MKPKKKKVPVGMILIGAVLVFICAYYCAAGMKPGYILADWYASMQEILEDPFQMYFNQYTVKTVLIMEGIYAFAVVMYLTGQRNYLPGKEMGSSQYADVRRVNRRLADFHNEVSDPKNIVIMQKQPVFRKKK